MSKIITAEDTSHNNIIRKSVAVSASMNRTLRCFLIVRFRHDSVEAASHFSVLQFDSKQNLRVRVQN